MIDQVNFFESVNTQKKFTRLSPRLLIILCECDRQRHLNACKRKKHTRERKCSVVELKPN